MPANKEAFIRYRIIDRMLKNKFKMYPSMDDIIDELEEKLGKPFSDSTIQKDIKAMKEDPLLGYNAPIKYSRKEGGYYYSDPNFTIAEIPLNENDISAIEFAANVLQQFQDIQLFNEFGSAVSKIFNAINVRSILDEEEVDKIIQFEKVPYFKGVEYLGQLLEAIKHRKVVSFNYTKFDANETKRHIVHPYLLKEYRHRWYLIGMIHQKDYIATFGLDRIDHIELEDISFLLSSHFSIQHYFKYSYGITTFKGEPKEVILAFDASQASYIKTQPLHETQEIIRETNQEVHIKLTVGITIELVMDVLSYGDRVEVIAPEELRKEIVEKITNASRKYNLSEA